MLLKIFNIRNVRMSHISECLYHFRRERLGNSMTNNVTSINMFIDEHCCQTR